MREREIMYVGKVFIVFGESVVRHQAEVQQSLYNHPEMNDISELFYLSLQKSTSVMILSRGKRSVVEEEGVVAALDTPLCFI